MATKLKIKRLALAVVLAGVSGLDVLYSYDNQNTHPDILTRNASGDTGGPNNNPPPTPGILSQEGSMYAEVREYFRRPGASNDIREGSSEEDTSSDLPFFPYKRVGLLSVKNHFYNPYTGKGIVGMESALEYAPNFWRAAIKSYGKGTLEDAYYTLGRAAHYVEDMGSPAHTNVDLHLSLEALPFLGENDFEHWAANNGTFVSGFTGSEVEGYPTFKSFEDFIHQHALFTSNTTRIKAHLTKNLLTPATGAFERMFLSPAQVSGPTAVELGLPYIEYVPLDSPDYDPINREGPYWWIVNVGYCFSGPDGSPRAEDDWWRAEPRSEGEYYWAYPHLQASARFSSCLLRSPNSAGVKSSNELCGRS